MDNSLPRTPDNVRTLPRNWERAFGYRGDARFVAFYWTPAGDEAMYTDGRSSGDGNWRLFLDLKDTLPGLENGINLGYSDLEADHWLLLDRESHQTLILDKATAQRRLEEQWPRVEPTHMTEAEVTAFYRRLAEALNRANEEWRQAQPQVCPICWQTPTPGWYQTEKGDFDECPACHGHGFVQEVEGND